MNVTCPNCATVYRVDPAKVPERGVRARCQVCAAVFPVSHTARENQSTAGSEPPSVPMERPAPAPAPAPAGAPLGGRAPDLVTAMVPSDSLEPTAPEPPRQGAPAPTSPKPAQPGPPPPPPASRPPAVWAPPAIARPSAPLAAAPGPAQRPVAAHPPRPAGGPAPAAPPGKPLAAGGPPRSPAPGRLLNPFLSQDPEQKARRLARALVSDLAVYHPEKRREGLQSGTLKEVFRDEIQKSWEEYSEQVGKELAESTTHFTDALNDILAGGQKIF